MKITTKDDRRQRIKLRLRKRISGTTERPRLSVFRSVSHVYAQVIDDMNGQTLVAASSLDPALKATLVARRPCSSSRRVTVLGMAMPSRKGHSLYSARRSA